MKDFFKTYFDKVCRFKKRHPWYSLLSLLTLITLPLAISDTCKWVVNNWPWIISFGKSTYFPWVSSIVLALFLLWLMIEVEKKDEKHREQISKAASDERLEYSNLLKGFFVLHEPQLNGIYKCIALLSRKIELLEVKREVLQTKANQISEISDEDRDEDFLIRRRIEKNLQKICGRIDITAESTCNTQNANNNLKSEISSMFGGYLASLDKEIKECNKQAVIVMNDIENGISHR